MPRVVVPIREVDGTLVFFTTFVFMNEIPLGIARPKPISLEVIDYPKGLVPLRGDNKTVVQISAA